MSNQMLVRCGEPGKYDHNPYGTICRSNNQSDGWFEIYVQINADDSNPEWQLVGTFHDNNSSTEDIEHMVDKTLKMKSH